MRIPWSKFEALLGNYPVGQLKTTGPFHKPTPGPRTAPHPGIPACGMAVFSDWSDKAGGSASRGRPTTHFRLGVFYKLQQHYDEAHDVLAGPLGETPAPRRVSPPPQVSQVEHVSITIVCGRVLSGKRSAQLAAAWALWPMPRTCGTTPSWCPRG